MSSEVTQEQFDAALEELVDAMSTAELLSTPGVYEALSEALNNEAIERAEENAAAENPPPVEEEDDEDEETPGARS